MFSSVNTCWTLVGAFLVYFMQAGFALCEAGFTRAKNTGNILMKNMMDFCIGTPCYWLIGFGLMFGGTGALIGGFDPFIHLFLPHQIVFEIPIYIHFHSLLIILLLRCKSLLKLVRQSVYRKCCGFPSANHSEEPLKAGIVFSKGFHDS